MQREDGGRRANGEVAPAPRPREATAAANRAFRIEGMDCAEEVAVLRREVGPLVGGDAHLAFDLLSGHMHVDATSAQASDDEIRAAVARAGLRVGALAEADGLPASWWTRHGRLATTAASAGAIAAGLAIHAFAAGDPLAALGVRAGTPPPPATALVCYLLAVVAGGWFVAPRALSAARAWRPDMNLLMTIAVIGALAIGQWLEAASVAFLFALALLLESWSLARARHAVRSLLDLEPPRARLLAADGSERDVAPAGVPVGAVVVVRPGERVPLDGVVAAGSALMDTAPVTGESRPRAVSPGDEVFAGTIATDGALEVRVTRPAADSVLARIVRRIAEAGRRRARVERWVDRFALAYTPIVFAAALATATIAPLLGLGGWRDFLYRGLVLLVIGCPCALVIATPVAVVAALAAAARHGVLVKGGDVLEVPARVRAVAFDKTGTLTRGELRVAAIHTFAGTGAEELLAVAVALERRSAHPVALAILRAGAERGIEAAAAEGVRILPGRGVEGAVAGRPAWLGSPRLAEERGAATAELRALAAGDERLGRSHVAVGRGDRAIGLLALADEARPEARAAIEELRRLGVGSVAMLTGDGDAAARATALATGIADVRARLLPEDKIVAIEALKRADPRGGPALVAFVGDGVNDAPALAAADIGIAVGESASHAALETADVALVTPDLRRVPWLIRHSRRTRAVIRTNVAFALATKAVFVVLTAVGRASLWSAIAADMGASLLVIFNSLRLLRRRDYQ